MCGVAQITVAAQSVSQAPTTRPSYELLRDEEDWSFLRDPSQRSDWLDPIKFIPLSRGGDTFLTLGGEVRQQYERFQNEAWGSEPEDKNGYSLQRYMFHADLHVRQRFRAFVQLKSGIEAGRVGGPRPPDEDQLDLHQAFADIGVVGPELGGPGVLLRVGRQELSFGSQRLVAVRESPNVRQSFDAIRAIAHVAGWRVDVFASFPVTTETGVFDDRPDNTRALWGVYTVRAFDAARKHHVDLYYIGLNRDEATFDQGTGPERRHSVGTRLWGQLDRLDYNTEAVWQWGSFANGPIHAWTVASDTGWCLGLPGRPRLGMRADVTSGDADRNQPVLQTFNALFPKGAYFGLIAPTGPYNSTDLHPQFDLALPNDWTLTGDWLWFWRTRRDDGIYNVPGRLLRSGQNAQARFVGQAPGVEVTKSLTPHLSLNGQISWFSAGAFIQETQPARDIFYMTVMATYIF
jgi:Alginate export